MSAGDMSWVGKVRTLFLWSVVSGARMFGHGIRGRDRAVEWESEGEGTVKV
jgi:hypothetical protein